jgi:hypothetical protein
MTLGMSYPPERARSESSYPSLRVRPLTSSSGGAVEFPSLRRLRITATPVGQSARRNLQEGRTRYERRHRAH